jgi:hypothetical protein
MMVSYFSIIFISSALIFSLLESSADISLGSLTKNRILKELREIKECGMAFDR